MDDKALLDLLLDCVKQGGSRNYFGFARFSSDSKLKQEQIGQVDDEFEECFALVKHVLSGEGVDKLRVRYLKAKIVEGSLFTELSKCFDIYYGMFVSFLGAFFIAFFYIKGIEDAKVGAVILTAIVLGAAVLSKYRTSQTIAQQIRLERLKNYLDIYSDNMSAYQENKN